MWIISSHVRFPIVIKSFSFRFFLLLQEIAEFTAIFEGN